MAIITTVRILDKQINEFCKASYYKDNTRYREKVIKQREGIRSGSISNKREENEV